MEWTIRRTVQNETYVCLLSHFKFICNYVSVIPTYVHMKQRNTYVESDISFHSSFCDSTEIQGRPYLCLIKQFHTPSSAREIYFHLKHFCYKLEVSIAGDTFKTYSHRVSASVSTLTLRKGIMDFQLLYSDRVTPALTLENVSQFHSKRHCCERD